MLKVLWDLWWLLYYKFTAEFPLKEFLKSVNIWQSYEQEIWLPQARPWGRVLSCWKMNSPEIWHTAGRSYCNSKNYDNRPHWRCLGNRQSHGVLSTTFDSLTMCELSLTYDGSSEIWKADTTLRRYSFGCRLIRIAPSILIQYATKTMQSDKKMNCRYWIIIKQPYCLTNV